MFLGAIGVQSGRCLHLCKGQEKQSRCSTYKDTAEGLNEHISGSDPFPHGIFGLISVALHLVLQFKHSSKVICYY